METNLRKKKFIAIGFLLIHSVAILIFTRGFLLTRTELPFHSACSDVSLSPCLASSPRPNHDPNSYSGSDLPNQNQPKCWTKPVVDRVVIIVLDALRFKKFRYISRIILTIAKAFRDFDCFCSSESISWPRVLFSQVN